MKKEWETQTLGDVLEVLRNGVNCKQDKKGLGQKITRIETIAQAEFNLDKVGYSKLKESDKVKYKIERGDILFSHINSVVHVGKTALYNSDEELYHGVNLLLMRPKDFLLPNCLEYFLKSLFISGYWRTICKQSVNQASVNQQDIGKVAIHFPKSLPEQQRIVSVLDEAFAFIAQAKSNAERNLQNAKELLASLLIKVFLEGINNKKWSLDKLEKYNKVVVGYVGPISKDYTNDDDGILLLSTKNISDNGINLEKLTRINRQFHNKNKKSQLVPGDILVARHGNSGQAAVIPDSINEAHALNVIVIKNSSTLSSEYLAFLLNSGVLDKISASKAGSVQAIINTSIIKDLVIPVPPLAEQRAIVGRLEALSAETKRLEEIYRSKVEAMEELKKSILQRVFKGAL
jgi:type I restriction enzyme S subunit